MNRILILVSLIGIIINTTTSKDNIEPIELKIRSLKDQLFEEIKGNKQDAVDYKEVYDYVDGSKKLIEPIEFFSTPVKVTPDVELTPDVQVTPDDKMTPDDKVTSDDVTPDDVTPEVTFKNLEVLTTATMDKYMGSPENADAVGALRIKKPKAKKSKRTSKRNKMEIFYRRTIFDGNARDKPQKWTHCLDLVSPFLNGFLSNVTETKRVVVTDGLVMRLSYLLGLNMSDANADEIRSILFELSSLQLRLYQWDVAAIRQILSIIIHDKHRHDFKGLKYGIKSLFATWKLNTSNLTRVFTQSRIFRPPCLQITPYGGSTVTPRHDHSRYTKKPVKNKNCNRRNHDGECLE